MRKALITLIVCVALIGTFAMTSVASASRPYTPPAFGDQTGWAGDSSIYKFTGYFNGYGSGFGVHNFDTGNFIKHAISPDNYVHNYETNNPNGWVPP